MFTTVLTTFLNAIAGRVASTLQGFSNIKFYFIVGLVFIASIAFMLKEPITLYIKSKSFTSINFRECRDVSGLEKALNEVLQRHPNCEKYTVYLYQPKDESFYKKLILTTSVIAKNSPSLQSIYLKDQPTIMEAFKTRDFYLFDKNEAMDKQDLKYLYKLNINSALFFKLMINDQAIGEIAFRFKQRPSAEELDILIKELSPLIYMYVI